MDSDVDCVYFDVFFCMCTYVGKILGRFLRGVCILHITGSPKQYYHGTEFCSLSENKKDMEGDTGRNR